MNDSEIIIEHLKSLGDSKIAQHSQRFFKTLKGEYGYGDKFLGIRVPVLRQNLREYKSMPAEVFEQLLQSEYHEIRLFALFGLVRRFGSFPHERETVYRIYLDKIGFVNNWDLVDSSCHQIIGGYLEDKDKGLLDLYAESDSLWERRIAIITTLHYIKKNHFEDTLRIAKILLEDSEDLIHKAVGWMLREVGNRNLQQEKDFLKIHYRKMPRTMLRYAIEKFPAEERKQYLLGQV